MDMRQKLDIMDSEETQLSILVPYLESVAAGNESDLPITKRTLVLVARILAGWHGLFKSGAGQEPAFTPEGAFLYYLRLEKGK